MVLKGGICLLITVIIDTNELREQVKPRISVLVYGLNMNYDKKDRFRTLAQISGQTFARMQGGYYIHREAGWLVDRRRTVSHARTSSP